MKTPRDILAENDCLAGDGSIVKTYDTKLIVKCMIQFAEIAFKYSRSQSTKKDYMREDEYGIPEYKVWDYEDFNAFLKLLKHKA